MRWKHLNSIKDYISVVLALTVYFTSIRATRHYEEEHAKDVPWHTVIQIILTTKNPRKKGDVYEIETATHYVLFTIEKGTLSVINAKVKR